MSGSTRVSRYQKGKTKKVKTNLDLLEQETVRKGSGICWAICKSAPHADNHANIPPLFFLQAGCPSWRPTNSVKALKAKSMGDRGFKKAYTGPRTGIYLPTKFGCDRSIVVGCRSCNNRQTTRQTSRNDNKAHSLRTWRNNFTWGVVSWITGITDQARSLSVQSSHLHLNNS